MTTHTNYNTPESILSIFQQYHGTFNLTMIQQYYSPLNEHELQSILAQLVADGSIKLIENNYYVLA